MNRSQERAGGAASGSSVPHPRRAVRGTPERPRLAVFRSGKHIYAQVIDDAAGTTLASASSLDAGAEGRSAKARRQRRRRQARRQARRRARQGEGHRRASCSTAAATSTTAASRRWPTPPAKAGWSSRAMRTVDEQQPGRTRERRAIARKSATLRAGADRPRRPHQPRDEGRQGRQELLASARSSSSATATGCVGYGIGKAKEVPSAIKKGDRGGQEEPASGAARRARRFRTPFSATSARAACC